MAGGEGSRLRPLTINRPKPMVAIVNKPCLGHIFDLVKRHGFKEAVVTLQYLANVIQDAYGAETLAECAFSGPATFLPKWSGNIQAEYTHPVTSTFDGYVRGLLTWRLAPDASIRVLHNGIDVGTFKFPVDAADSKRIVFCGVGL